MMPEYSCCQTRAPKLEPEELLELLCVEALELEVWRSEQPAEGVPSERPNLFH